MVSTQYADLVGERGLFLNRVIITKVTDNAITLDGNHPLAGQELIFEVKLLEVVTG